MVHMGVLVFVLILEKLTFFTSLRVIKGLLHISLDISNTILSLAWTFFGTEKRTVMVRVRTSPKISNVNSRLDSVNQRYFFLDLPRIHVSLFLYLQIRRIECEPPKNLPHTGE